MLVAGTAIVPLPSLQPMSTISPEGAGSSSASGIGGFNLSGLNGGPAAPSTAGSAGSIQTQNNTGGNSGSAKPFQGSRNKIGVQWEALGIVMIIMTTVMLSGFGNNFVRI